MQNKRNILDTLKRNKEGTEKNELVNNVKMAGKTGVAFRLEIWHALLDSTDVSGEAEQVF